MDISVIIPTCRHDKLPITLEQIRQQSIGNLRIEPIVVIETNDEGDLWLFEHTLEYYGGIRHAVYPIRGGYGSEAKNNGMLLASGEYVVFWDDDNIYFQHCLATMYAITSGYDIGIASVAIKNLNDFVERGTDRIPANPKGFTLIPRTAVTKDGCDIDTMSICVRTEIARKTFWPMSYNNDSKWIQQLLNLTPMPTLRQVPIQVGIHI